MKTELRVSEISAASPDMDDAQFNELVEDIRKHGQLVPVWKCGDEIIDGRKRARACSMLGIPLSVVDMSNGGDPEALSYSLNVLRTHYTISQRAIYAARQVNHAIKQDVGHFGQLTKVEKTIAKDLAVSDIQVRRARRIIREADPEVVTAVEAGKLNINQAGNIIRSNARGDQGKAVKKISPFKKSPSRPLPDRMVRGLDQLENAIDLLGQFLDEKDAHDHDDHRDWLKRLYKARTALSRIIKNQGGHDE